MPVAHFSSAFWEGSHFSSQIIIDTKNLKSYLPASSKNLYFYKLSSNLCLNLQQKQSRKKILKNIHCLMIILGFRVTSTIWTLESSIIFNCFLPKVRAAFTNTTGNTIFLKSFMIIPYSLALMVVVGTLSVLAGVL